MTGSSWVEKLCQHLSLNFSTSWSALTRAPLVHTRPCGVLPSPPPFPPQPAFEGLQGHVTQMPFHSPASSLCGNVCLLLLETLSSLTFMTTFSYCRLFWPLLLCPPLRLLFILPLPKIRSRPLLSFPPMVSHMLQLQPPPLSGGCPISAPDPALTPYSNIQSDVPSWIDDQHLRFNTFQNLFLFKPSVAMMTSSLVICSGSRGLRTLPSVPHTQPGIKPDPLCDSSALQSNLTPSTAQDSASVSGEGPSSLPDVSLAL